MRYLIRMSYDGSHYHGFQRLPNEVSVQKEIEKVLTVLSGSPVEIKGAGRTDAGVHALDQCAHFDFSRDVDEENLKYQLNRMLSPYISIHSVIKVDSSFHARKDVVEKTYRYQIYLGAKNPFYAHYYYCYFKPIDVQKVKRAAKIFEGTHDFHNFVSGKRNDYISSINKVKVWQEQDVLFLEFKGVGFYRYMVRKIVGALLMVGTGSLEFMEIKEALENPLVCKEFFEAPPQGLYLVKINY